MVRESLLVGSTFWKECSLSYDISKCAYSWCWNHPKVSWHHLYIPLGKTHFLSPNQKWTYVILSFSLPHWRGSVILVVTALKTFRSAFSDCSKQYLVLMLAILLFQYEPSTGFINGGAEGTDGSKVPFEFLVFQTLSNHTMNILL